MVMQEDETFTRVSKSLGLLDANLSKSPFVAGNEISIADLLIATELSALDVLSYDLTSFPSLWRWLEVRSRLSRSNQRERASVGAPVPVPTACVRVSRAGHLGSTIVAHGTQVLPRHLRAIDQGCLQGRITHNAARPFVLLFLFFFLLLVPFHNPESGTPDSRPLRYVPSNPHDTCSMPPDISLSHSPTRTPNLVQITNRQLWVAVVVRYS